MRPETRLLHLSPMFKQHLAAINEALAQVASRALVEVRPGVMALELDARRLGEKGWVVPMWSVIADTGHLAALPQSKLDAFMVRSYGADGGARFRALGSGLLGRRSLGHWRPLIRQSLASYRRRSYLLVVPALLLVLEGAVAQHAGDFTKRRRSVNKSAAQTLQAFDVGIERVVWASLAAFLERTFGDHPFTGAPPATINRHWILHGRAVPKWNRVDCLRLFQAIDAIRG